MIIPTLSVEVWKKTGSDVYGQTKMVKKPSEMVAPVKLEFHSEMTSVRTDAAASKARAREGNASVVILALPKTQIELDDKLVIHGNDLMVTSVHPRYTVTGKLDHYHIECQAWA